jgi:hypothetical protein
MSAQPGGEGSKITLSFNLKEWEKFEIFFIQPVDRIEDIEFILNDAQIISNTLSLLYESSFVNESSEKQTVNFSFEKETKLMSQWTQQIGGSVFGECKIRFKKLAFENGKIINNDLDIIEADFRNKNEIIEKFKIKTDCGVDVQPGKIIKFSSSYERITVRIPWIGILCSNNKKNQISGDWDGVLIGNIINKFE